MKLYTVFVKSLYKPLNTFSLLLNSKESIKFGWIFTIGFAILYTITAVILTIKDFIPIAEPSIPIPLQEYYFWQCFFAIPIGIIGVALNYCITIGFLRLFSIKLGSQKLWGPISIASVLPFVFTTWIPETFIVAVFYDANEWTYLTFDMIRIAIGSLWAVILTILAVKSVEDVKWLQSILIGIISSGAMGTLMGIFYR